MFEKHRVALRLVALLLPGLLFATAAPVGHRQPTAADVAAVPKDAADARREKRERELDKKLQICRGC